MRLLKVRNIYTVPQPPAPLDPVPLGGLEMSEVIRFVLWRIRQWVHGAPVMAALALVVVVLVLAWLTAF